MPDFGDEKGGKKVSLADEIYAPTLNCTSRRRIALDCTFRNRLARDSFFTRLIHERINRRPACRNKFRRVSSGRMVPPLK